MNYNTLKYCDNTIGEVVTLVSVESSSTSTTVASFFSKLLGRYWVYV